MTRGQRFRLVLALLVGCGGLVAGAIISVYSVQFISRSERVSGVVVELVKKSKQQMEPVVAYRVAGKEHRMLAGHASSPPSHGVGDAVTVLYDTDRPERGVVSPYFQLWLTPLMCFLLGGIFVGVGITGLRRKPVAAP